MIKNISEDFFHIKINNSFSTKKPLSGLNERKLIKFYKKNKESLRDKENFEEYILKADLYNNLLKRKKIMLHSSFTLLYIIFVYLYSILTNNILSSLLLFLIEILLIIYLLIKLIKFFKTRKINFLNKIK